MSDLLQLILWALGGTIVAFLLDWAINKKMSTEWYYYALSFIIVAVLAYNINELAVKALIIFLAGIASARILRGVVKFAKRENI